MTAAEIKLLLKKKHRKDFFITEVKDGGTWFRSPETPLRKLDAWALEKSWIRYNSTGYEIKVSRSDFKQDIKWQDYLKYCSRFYFVCPKGLILPTELPINIGLIWVNPNGFLRTVRSAQFYKREIYIDFLLYILMNKVNDYRIPVEASARDIEFKAMQRYCQQLENELRSAHYQGYNMSRDLVNRLAQEELL